MYFYNKFYKVTTAGFFLSFYLIIEGEVYNFYVTIVIIGFSGEVCFWAVFIIVLGIDLFVFETWLHVSSFLLDDFF